MSQFLDPFWVVRPEQRRMGVTSLAIATGVIGAVVVGLDQPLHSEHAPLGIVSLQLAGTPEAAGRILSTWSDDQRLLAAFGLGFDYLFLVLYSAALGFGCVVVADAVTARRPRFARAGVSIAWSLVLGAALDMVEDASLLVVVRGPVVSPWPEIAWACAVPKFLIICVSIGYIVTGVVLVRSQAREVR